MDQTRLYSSSSVTEAEWLRERLRFFTYRVTSIVPAGFPAYLRILHPARFNEESLRWADVAAKSGRRMHRLAQFHAISRPKTGVSMGSVVPPARGNLRTDQLAGLCEVLAKHTSTPEACWFCLWDGFGWLNTRSSGPLVFTKIDPAREESLPDQPIKPWSSVLTDALLNAPRVRFPGREYLLFAGPLEAAADFETLAGQSPNLFWPQDHAWCVASEIDLFCTLAAGSDELAASLIADSRLEVWRVLADDRVDAGSDDKNT